MVNDETFSDIANAYAKLKQRVAILEEEKQGLATEKDKLREKYTDREALLKSSLQDKEQTVLNMSESNKQLTSLLSKRSQPMYQKKVYTKENGSIVEINFSDITKNDVGIPIPIFLTSTTAIVPYKDGVLISTIEEVTHYYRKHYKVNLLWNDENRNWLFTPYEKAFVDILENVSPGMSITTKDLPLGDHLPTKEKQGYVPSPEIIALSTVLRKRYYLTYKEIQELYKKAGFKLSFNRDKVPTKMEKLDNSSEF